MLMNGWMEKWMEGKWTNEKSVAQLGSLSSLGWWAELSQPHSLTFSSCLTLMSSSPSINEKKKYFVARREREDVTSGCR